MKRCLPLECFLADDGGAHFTKPLYESRSAKQLSEGTGLYVPRELLYLG